MDVYLFPIEVAAATFVVMSMFLTLPYMLIQYIKYGAVSLFRALILFSFFLYMLCAYYLTVLPLPDPTTFAPTADIWHYINLTPFRFVHDIIVSTPLKITDIRTYLPALQQPVVYQAIFNVLLNVPFGMYLGYYFKKSLGKTVLFTFLLSLFFELTQLSGLYWFYPHPYRVFDVDDLITNTLGGFVGFIAYKHCLRFLPSRDKIDEKNKQSSEKVGYIRRLFAFGIDYLIVLIPMAVLEFTFSLNPLIFNIVLFAYFIASQLLFKQTIGKALVHIRIQPDDAEAKYKPAVVLRYTMLCFVISLINVLDYLSARMDDNLLIYSILTFAVNVFVLVDVLVGLRRGKILLYEKLSKTRNVSTLKTNG